MEKSRWCPNGVFHHPCRPMRSHRDCIDNTIFGHENSDDSTVKLPIRSSTVDNERQSREEEEMRKHAGNLLTFVATQIH